MLQRGEPVNVHCLFASSWDGSGKVATIWNPLEATWHAFGPHFSCLGWPWPLHPGSCRFSMNLVVVSVEGMRLVAEIWVARPWPFQLRASRGACQ